MIDKNTEPDDVTSETSPCAQRDFVANLLQTLASANPAVIVIDKFYPDDACTAERSAALVAALNEVSKRLPLVLARFDRSEAELQARDPERLRVLHATGAVVSAKTMKFDPEVKYGLRTLNYDERKIPLEWPVYTGEDFDKLSASQLSQMRPQLEDTVATTAVRQYDPGTIEQHTIRSFIREDVHPYTSFLTPSEMPTYSPIDLICDRDHARDVDWRSQCVVRNPQSQRLREFRNRVVVIGQNDSRDIHRTVIGRVPGVILQANYIESLLDDRYLKPSNFVLELIISIGWLAVVEYFFTLYESRPLRALLLSAGSVVFLWLLTYDIAVLQLGRYLVLWPPSAVAMVGRYALLKLKPSTKSIPVDHPVVEDPATA